MKINGSQLARELDVDPRTIQKYLDGLTKKTTKDKGSKIDEHYGIIAALLSEVNKQIFYYKRVLWKYLKDNYSLEYSASAFRTYIVHKPVSEAYFK